MVLKLGLNSLRIRISTVVKMFRGEKRIIINNNKKSNRTEPCPNNCGNLKMPQSSVCTSCAANQNRQKSLQNRRQKASATEVGRICTKCGEFRPWELFRNHKRGLNGKSAECLNCMRQWYKNQKHYLKLRCWTKEQWEACFFLQNGVCAIDGCNNLATDADHCHETEEPRALLCGNCNTALGMMEEDIPKIRGLLEYAMQCSRVKEFVDD